MSLFFNSFFVEAILTLFVVYTIAYWYFRNAYKYWELRRVPTPRCSFPWGHFGPVLFGTESLGQCLQKAYNEFRIKHKYVGLYYFNRPAILVVDPEQIKSILVRDFNNFNSHGLYMNEKDDPLSAHMFSLEGLEWKNLRMKLSPTFTSGKLKYMFPTIEKLAQNLGSYLKEEIKKDNTIEMKDIIARYATDIIGTCAFGIECNSLSDPNAEFRRYGQEIFKRTIVQNFKVITTSFYPNLSRWLGITITDPEVSTFFMDTVKNAINYREENNIKRTDFMNLLIQLKNNGMLEDDSPLTIGGSNFLTITIEEAAAQAYLFFLAGFETSSITMSFCLYELAINPDIQVRVRQEIKKTLQNARGKTTYEALMDMPYLDRVIDETLRKYPPIPVLPRMCTRDCYLPESEIAVKKSMNVLISVRGLHYDPKFYPDPEKFDPDRFTNENKGKRHRYTYLPFGEGPRICIGNRFGMMQIRLGLIYILQNFSLQKSDKTPVPLVLDPKNMLTSCLGGIWLNLTELK